MLGWMEVGGARSRVSDDSGTPLGDSSTGLHSMLKQPHQHNPCIVHVVKGRPSSFKANLHFYWLLAYYWYLLLVLTALFLCRS